INFITTHLPHTIVNELVAISALKDTYGPDLCKAHITFSGETISPLREIGKVCGIGMDPIESKPSCGLPLMSAS
ncbi:hypothetical protein A2U01_0010087, partial [Trifolium medium]|nr:hypothetical protein [Trifolium medium]